MKTNESLTLEEFNDILDKAWNDKEAIEKIRAHFEPQPEPADRCYNAVEDGNGHLRFTKDGGRTLRIEVRDGGEYEGKGFYLSAPLKGYEYAVVEDSDGLNVLVLREKS